MGPRERQDREFWIDFLGGEWRNGIRRGLKIPGGKLRAGSTPASPTKKYSEQPSVFLFHVWYIDTNLL